MHAQLNLTPFVLTLGPSEERVADTSLTCDYLADKKKQKFSALVWECPWWAWSHSALPRPHNDL